MIKEHLRPTKSQKLGWKDFADDRLILTLQRMHKLNNYALQNEIKSDQLAVPISDFRRWGHSDTELRLLVVEGVLLHLTENREGCSDQREFEKGGVYSIGETSCFVLSEHMQNLLKQGSKLVPPLETSYCAAEQPHWDSKLRRLMCQGKLLKHFRCPAPNQETILSAFQEEGWPERISDPIPPSEETDSKQRLHDAIRSLNRNQANTLIKFRGDGTGEGVLWCLVQTLPELPSKRR